MTDLEITKLCAEAIGLEVAEQLGMMMSLNTQYEIAIYDPLHDDAQAMALVKKFNLSIYHTGIHYWSADWWDENEDRWGAYHTDLNRAICETVARMMQAKVPA